jgi:hypothetical protein
MFDSGVLLYNTDITRLREMLKALQDCKHTYSPVDSAEECMKKIDSGDYNTLLLEHSRYDYASFEVEQHAVSKGLRVIHYGRKCCSEPEHVNSIKKHVKGAVKIKPREKRD